LDNSISGNVCFRRINTEMVEVRTSRGVTRAAMLFRKAILEAEWAADAPLREAMAIKRERLRSGRPSGRPSSVQRETLASRV
jgi:hypothetical protein